MRKGVKEVGYQEMLIENITLFRFRLLFLLPGIKIQGVEKILSNLVVCTSFNTFFQVHVILKRSFVI